MPKEGKKSQRKTGRDEAPGNYGLFHTYIFRNTLRMGALGGRIYITKYIKHEMQPINIETKEMLQFLRKKKNRKKAGPDRLKRELQMIGGRRCLCRD